MSKTPTTQLLVLDVDGVLTDGGLYVDDKGHPAKKFNVKDGLGIKLAQRFGIQVAILTGKNSHVVAHRAKELGIEHVIQGSKTKVPTSTGSAKPPASRSA